MTISKEEENKGQEEQANKSELNLSVEKVMEILHVNNKDYGDMVFKMKGPQKDLYNCIKDRQNKREGVKIIVLKARQLGISTFAVVLMTAMCLCLKNQNMLLVAQSDSTSQELHTRIMYAINHLPKELQPELDKDNSEIVSFKQLKYLYKDGKPIELNNQIHIMTAGLNNDSLGRGSSYNFIHASEYPQWAGNKKQKMQSLLQSVSQKGIFIIESTAKGYDDFKTRWDTAVAYEDYNNPKAWIPKFYSWVEEPAYTYKYDGFALNSEEKDLITKCKASLESIAWRRQTLEHDFNGDINMFHQEMPATPEEAFLSTGDCVFNMNTLNERIYQIRESKEQPEDIGYFTYGMEFDEISHERKIKDIQWVSDRQNGYITLYKRVESRIPYVFGLDTSGEGVDYHAGYIINNITSKQVCTLHINKLSSLELSAQAYCLGKYYNNALLIPEINYSSDVTVNLKEFGYDNIYITQNVDVSTSTQLTKRLGFKTTTLTRPILMSKVIDFVNNYSYNIVDIRVLQECQNFIRMIKEIDGRTISKEQANYGKHDDLVMSMAITLYGRDSGQQSFELLEEEKVEENKPMSEFEKLFGRFEKLDNQEEQGGYYIQYD